MIMMTTTTTIKRVETLELHYTYSIYFSPSPIQIALELLEMEAKTDWLESDNSNWQVRSLCVAIFRNESKGNLLGRHVADCDLSQSSIFPISFSKVIVEYGCADDWSDVTEFDAWLNTAPRMERAARGFRRLRPSLKSPIRE